MKILRHFRSFRFLRSLRFLIATLLLITCSGCAELLVVGGATSAVASQDRRNVSTQIDDETIELKSFKTLFDDDELWSDTNISVISYNNVVLMVGQAPTASLKARANEEIKKISDVKKVYNQIRIAAPASFIARTQDSYLTSKVKSSMLFTADFSSSKIKVVTEKSEVFLLGLVSKAEAEKAVEIARNVDGVERVVKVFEYIED